MTQNTFYLYTIIVFFFAVGLILPFINQEFGNSSTYNTQGIEDLSGQEAQSSEANALSVLLSIFSMFFWTFGALPQWMDLLIFSPLRIILAVIFYDKIRGNG